MLVFIPMMKDDFLLFLFSFLFLIQSIIIPIWFFQGLEKMQYITIIDVASRLIFLLLVYSFVNKTEDYLLVPILRLTGVFLAGLFSIYLIFFKEKVRLKLISVRDLKYYFREGLPFFYSQLSTVINARTNTLLLGIFSGMSLVAYYDFVSKVVEGLNAIFGILIKVLYPHISLTENIKKAKKIFYFNLILSSIFYIFLCLCAKKIIILFFGDISFPAHSLFYIMGLLLPLVSIEWSLGDLLLAPFGHAKEYSLSSIYSTIFYLIMIGMLFVCGAVSLYPLIASLLIRFIFISSQRYYYCKKYKLM